MPVIVPGPITIVRPCRRSYLTILFIFLPLALLGLFVVFKGATHDWAFVYVPTLLWLGCLLWLNSLYVVIGEGTFSDHTLFRTRSIRLADIEKAETELVGTGQGVYRALTIYPISNKTQQPMRINIGAYSREDLGKMFDLLAPKFQGARSIGIYTKESA